MAEKLEYGLYSWSIAAGLVDVLNGKPENAQDPLEAVEAIDRLPEQSLVLMRDLHLHLEDGNPVLLRAIREVLVRCKSQGKVLIACGCRNTLPPELEREFVVVESRLPGKDALAEVLNGICESAELDSPEEDTNDAVLEAAAGLTCAEAENAFALSVVETGTVEASVFERPLLKLDAGRLYGGLVGESERNLRTAIQTAEAVAPCVLWIDEIEKGFGGGGSGQLDGGTSSRVFGSFISWMQEKTAPVFIVATANDVQRLPPEMLRKGRWDELWFVDLPGKTERQAIWRIQIAKYGRDPDA